MVAGAFEFYPAKGLWRMPSESTHLSVDRAGGLRNRMAREGLSEGRAEVWRLPLSRRGEAVAFLSGALVWSAPFYEPPPNHFVYSRSYAPSSLMFKSSWFTGFR